MLTGKALIQATRKYAKEDRKKSWLLLISTMILLILAYAGAIQNTNIIIQIACSIVAGLLGVRMFIMYHDYLHRTILQDSWIAQIWFTLYGMFILAPTSIWKRSHDYHHSHNAKLYTSSIGSFPLVTKKDYLAASRFDRGVYLFIRHPLTILFGYIFAFIWGMCLRAFIKSTSKHLDTILALIFHFGIGALIYHYWGFQNFLLGFLFPAFLNSAMGAYLFYAQHNFPDAKYTSKEDWDYTYAALKSSSYMQMSSLMQWFTGNIGYHHIHHINPRIPFYKLPLVYKEMEEFQSPGVTSLSPKSIYKCFRVKVWDAENNKMIGLKEL